MAVRFGEPLMFPPRFASSNRCCFPRGSLRRTAVVARAVRFGEPLLFPARFASANRFCSAVAPLVFSNL